MKNLFILFSVLIIIHSVSYTQSLREKHLNSMIATEYSFSDKSIEVGFRDAFLTYIADDGILFRPDPVNGKQFLEAQQTRPGILSWFPSYAFISKAGDMGFTTGPWEFRTHKDSTPVAFGNYCTVWQLNKNGDWEFLIDYGINNNKPEKLIEGLKFNKNIFDNELSIQNNMKEDSSNIVVEVDQVFNMAVTQEGIKKNYAVVCDRNSRLLREGFYPIIGTKEIKTFNDTAKTKLKFTTYNAKTSLSNDFGYAFGSAEIENDQSKQKNIYYYLRIWRLEETGWKIAIEVTSITSQ